MTIDRRTPTTRTFNQDQGGYIEIRANEEATLEFDYRLQQVAMLFYSEAAADAAKQFFIDAEIQRYLSAKKRLISRVRGVMREHSPARG